MATVSHQEGFRQDKDAGYQASFPSWVNSEASDRWSLPPGVGVQVSTCPLWLLSGRQALEFAIPLGPHITGER